MEQAAQGPAEHRIDEFSELVLEVVEAIPPGRVLAYGDIAELLGRGGPRQVGRVMSRYGGGVPWWRVIRADGSPPPGHEREALARYRDEGTPMRGEPGTGAGPGAGGRPAARVDMRRARWDCGPLLSLTSDLRHAARDGDGAPPDDADRPDHGDRPADAGRPEPARRRTRRGRGGR
ncbi:alkylated DNA nucleotide flippase Atl1 [Allostreptomyces psammosilenae]|uniref:Alkylated DNA nucleotide flippase Atl1 n=1 Tax=Allostreptomyces psammosilenae TaxID=1892865 RepID=A0A853A191_9ACTN|nr:alkylated DNA nucleotide flippase Atl1 [Allostreptomyces psammosilenae]